MPSGCSEIRHGFHVSKYIEKTVEKSDRDFKADLMLAAIEENTGHMIILAVIEWGKFICLQYDHTKPVHSRIKLTACTSYCNKKKGYCY